MRWATESSRGRSVSNFSMRSTRGHLSFLSIVKGVGNENRRDRRLT
ncbi:Uncharacterised protein [Mycobacteroides abscessus subsp. abscessus]|nr:Uncharacterised protein [Mycobacteroides abscessus subsp. abscessus]